MDIQKILEQAVESQVSDIFFDEYCDIINIIKKNTKGSVTSCSISAEGICPICKNMD